MLYYGVICTLLNTPAMNILYVMAFQSSLLALHQTLCKIVVLVMVDLHESCNNENDLNES